MEAEAEAARRACCARRRALAARSAWCSDRESPARPRVQLGEVTRGQGTARRDRLAAASRVLLLCARVYSARASRTLDEMPDLIARVGQLGPLAQRHARAAAVLGAVAIAFSSILVRLSHASPSTAAIFRCVYALPVLGWL